MKRGLAVSVLLIAMIAAMSSANAAVKIKRIYFDPPGSVTGSNKSLNKEFVLIKNTGNKTVSLKGWKLVDAGQDHKYTFDGSIELDSGDVVRLRTGKGKDHAVCGCNGACHCEFNAYWDLDNYVWNNDGDKAKLKRRSGKLADSCSYSSSADSPKLC